MAPRVSVLMSVYNGGDYLRQAVDSVLNSDFEDLEFVIVDNFSTDGTRDYLQSLEDPRVRPILNEKNLGQTGALNVGLEACTAPYVARLDADDAVLTDRFALQAARLDGDPSLALIGGQAIRIDAAGNQIGATRLPVDFETIRWRMALQNCFVHSSVMFRRDAALAAGLYPSDFRVSQDFALFSAFLRAGHRLENLEQPVCELRTHPDQVMATGGRADELEETARVAALNQGWACNEAPDSARAQLVTRLWYGGTGENNPEEALAAAGAFLEELPAPARCKALLALVILGGPCLGNGKIRRALLRRAISAYPAIIFDRELYVRLVRALLPETAVERLRTRSRPSGV